MILSLAFRGLVYWGAVTMSTSEKYSYRFFTDKWMFLVVVGFYLVIRYKLLPGFITDVYLPFILCAMKFIWTKTSYVKVDGDLLTYSHKELPTYFRIQLSASRIKRMYFKVLFFTMIDRQYCLVEYLDENFKIKSLLINIERFSRPEKTRMALIAFCKRNNIEIIY